VRQFLDRLVINGDQNMRSRHLITLCAISFLCLNLGACTPYSEERVERYTSPHVQGESERINLDEVQKAFWDTKGKDLNTWMAAFEKRVNEIYEGKEVVSIDATRKANLLVVTGYIDKVNKEGFQAGDEKLFSIEQTGEAANNEMPYRVADRYDRPYYEGHHSILDNPFLQAMLISHMMGGWSGRYYTPPSQVVILRDQRDSFRQYPAFSQQKSANQGFFSRNPSQSSKGFGSSFSSSSGNKSRSWGSSSSSGGGGLFSSPSSGWGGRRSSGFGGALRRGWGGRRR
jgi:hypothetical protein